MFAQISKSLWYFSLLLAFVTASPGFADDDDAHQAKTLANLTENATLKLDKAAQTLANIVVTELKPATHQAEFLSYGKALSIQPLIDLHHRLFASRYEQERASARFNYSGQLAEREQTLFQAGISTQRKLLEHQAQWQTDKTQLDAAHDQKQAIIDEAYVNWGHPLADWALAADTVNLAAFIAGQQTLLRITLPSHRLAADNFQTIAVHASGERQLAQAAKLIATAPQTEASGQGLSYFFQTDGKTIKPGMNISAWLPEQSSRRHGVIIPASAVCWSGDQAWVFVQTDSDHFSQRHLPSYILVAGGYFVADDLKPGDKLVTTGAQVLLSEHMRGQIPDEDND